MALNPGTLAGKLPGENTASVMFRVPLGEQWPTLDCPALARRFCKPIKCSLNGSYFDHIGQLNKLQLRWVGRPCLQHRLFC